MLHRAAGVHAQDHRDGVARADLHIGGFTGDEIVGRNAILQRVLGSDTAAKFSTDIGNGDVALQLAARPHDGAERLDETGIRRLHVNEAEQPAVMDLGAERILAPAVADRIVVEVAVVKQRRSLARALDAADGVQAGRHVRGFGNFLEFDIEAALGHVIGKVACGFMLVARETRNAQGASRQIQHRIGIDLVEDIGPAFVVPGVLHLVFPLRIYVSNNDYYILLMSAT